LTKERSKPFISLPLSFSSPPLHSATTFSTFHYPDPVPICVYILVEDVEDISLTLIDNHDYVLRISRLSYNLQQPKNIL
jgi:hypothetical protein